MASTRLNESGKFNPDAIERQLAHQGENKVRAAYTYAAEFWAERVQMMQFWADYLDQLRGDTNTKVIEQAGSAAFASNIVTDLSKDNCDVASRQTSSRPQAVRP
jgi:hypothetical protein